MVIGQSETLGHEIIAAVVKWIDVDQRRSMELHADLCAIRCALTGRVFIIIDPRPDLCTIRSTE